MSEKKDPKDIWQDGSVVDRRSGVDRRDLQRDGDSGSGLERRRGPGRRLSDFTKAAEEGELTKEQFLFVAAIDAFKRANHKTFAEDWQEPADAPSGVRTVTRDKAA
jgi:hypothetical protein